MCITGNQKAQAKNKVFPNHKQRQMKIDGIYRAAGVKKILSESLK